MQVQAVTKNLRISAQKMRLAANKIRGKSVEQALEILTFAETKSAKLALKTLESAIANAENNEGADIDDLVVSECYVMKVRLCVVCEHELKAVVTQS